MGEKTDYEIRNIKFIMHIFLFFGGGEGGGGGGGKGWDMRNVAIPHQCQIFI